MLEILPYLLLLACPLMHLFMHHGHGGDIIKELVGDDPVAIARVKSAAEEAINARRDLWDGLAACLKVMNSHPHEMMRA